MANELYARGKEALLGTLDLLAANIKAVLVDIADYGLAVTGATNASPVVITSTGHGLSTGHRVAISQVGGNTAANGNWTITVVDANTFSLNGSTGNGAYTSGGRIVPLSLHQFLSDIPVAARVATSGNLASKTATNGVFDAADAQLASATGDQSEGLALYEDTGTATTSRLIAWIDTATNLPVTPNGGNIDILWNASGIFAI